MTESLLYVSIIGDKGVSPQELKGPLESLFPGRKINMVTSPSGVCRCVLLCPKEEFESVFKVSLQLIPQQHINLARPWENETYEVWEATGEINIPDVLANKVKIVEVQKPIFLASLEP